MAGLLGWLIGGILTAVAFGVIRNRYYNFQILKIIVIMVFSSLIGVVGTAILFFIENGRWGGSSFYGAIFIVPVFWLFFKGLLHEKYGQVMDMCSVSLCSMLAVMKIRCFVDGCCAGKVLFQKSNGIDVCFPSQIVEGVVVVIIIGILMLMEKRMKNKGELYAWLFVLYGSTRFILNFFRLKQSYFIGNISPGHFWSIISVLIGCMVLVYLKNKKRRGTL